MTSLKESFLAGQKAAARNAVFAKKPPATSKQLKRPHANHTVSYSIKTVNKAARFRKKEIRPHL